MFENTIMFLVAYYMMFQTALDRSPYFNLRSFKTWMALGLMIATLVMAAYDVNLSILLERM